MAIDPVHKVWLVSLGPKAKLQQLMMSIAQKVSDAVAEPVPAAQFPREESQPARSESLR